MLRSRTVSLTATLIALATLAPAAEKVLNRTPLPAPANLAAKAGDKKVTLNWTGVKRAESYNVYMSTRPGRERRTPVATDIRTTSFTKTGLTNGTKYYFTVTAEGGPGESPRSNEASATPVGKAEAPLAPTNLKATAGNQQIVLSWTASTGATSYNLYRGTTAGGESPTAIQSGITGTSFTNTGLTNGTKYFYMVAAVNTTGTSNKSNEANATPVGLPPAPTNLGATAGDQKVVLNWTAAAGATSYNLYRGTTAGGEAPAAIQTGITGTTFTNTGLTNGTKYFYMVAAVNSVGTGNKSNEANATPVGLPLAPTNLGATAGDQKVVLNWTAAAGATSYNLYRGTTAGGEAPAAIQTGITGTTFTNTGLTNGTKYFYMVAAVNSVGTGNKSNEANATPVGLPLAPTNLGATAGDQKVVLNWTAAAGATSYNLYRGTTAGGEAPAAIQTGITGTTFTNTGLTNGTKYFYMVAAVNSVGTGNKSNEASATPMGQPPAPANLGATAGDKLINLTWTASPGATSYSLFRGTTAGGQATTAIQTGITGTSFTNTGLVNGTTYFYKVAAVNAVGTGVKSNEASATPVGQPPAPTNLRTAAGDQTITLTWTASAGATTYNLYRGTAAGAEAPAPIQTGITGTSYTNTGLVNGTTYFYKLAAVNTVGTSTQSNEASGTPSGALLSAEQRDAFRFLRQSTFGPNVALLNHVVQVGKPAFLDEQFALPPTPYPETLVDMPNMELVSEQFFQNAVLGQDQLRQRVAWALSQILVVSAIKVDNTHAMVPYIRILEEGAFGNAKDLIRAITLSPAMGEFLDMVNNKKATSSTMPNENYARELLQLLTIGLQKLNIDGTPELFNTQTIPTFSQADIADLARAFTGWTYGDANLTNPNNLNQPYYLGPMKPVERFHDTGQKSILGQLFNPGQTAQQDLDQALNLIFNHQNVGPFLSRQLIQKLVTSNPSPAYIADVAAVFNNNGQGVRGDLKAVVRAILLHPQAANGTPTSGKFQEPALFLAAVSRALGATIVDHPFLTDFSQNLAQRIWFAPSVFNYYSPNYRSGTLFAPEMQIWTAATAMTRTNFMASLVSGGFGSDVTIDYSPYTAVAGTPAALIELVNARIMGGTMSPEMKQAIQTALLVSTNSDTRVRTAIYLAATSMLYQVEH